MKLLSSARPTSAKRLGGLCPNQGLSEATPPFIDDHVVNQSKGVGFCSSNNKQIVIDDSKEGDIFY
jgi:hypothetical protein